jgi:hypothetical protein
VRFASKRERGSKHLYRQAKSLLLDNSTSLGIGHSLRVSIVGYRELFLEHLSFTVQIFYCAKSCYSNNIPYRNGENRSNCHCNRY